MAEIEFEWDPEKDRANQAKHGVSFAEASTAFYDENGLLLDDPCCVASPVTAVVAREMTVSVTVE